MKRLEVWEDEKRGGRWEWRWEGRWPRIYSFWERLPICDECGIDSSAEALCGVSKRSEADSKAAESKMTFLRRSSSVGG
jgi:hypothetical protein